MQTSEWDSPTREGVVHDVPTSMHEQVKNWWVEALVGGLHPQSSSTLLRSEDGFTAEGVLADLAVHAGVSEWNKLDGVWILTPPGTSIALNSSVYDWAGCKGMHLSQMFPLTYQGKRHPIWRLEDHYNLDFNALAKLIDEQY